MLTYRLDVSARRTAKLTISEPRSPVRLMGKKTHNIEALLTAYVNAGGTVTN